MITTQDVPSTDLEPSQAFVARCAASVASSSSDALVVLTTAARLHQLWLPSDLDAVHLAAAVEGRTGRRMSRSRRPEWIAHRRELPSEDRTIVYGVPATTPARTWRDLAATAFTLPDLVAVGDSVLRAGSTARELALVVRRTASHRGVRKARMALELLDERSRSRPESHLRVALMMAGLPRFAVNEAVFRDEGGWLAEPDLSLAEAKIAIEYQGSEHAELTRMRRDLTRSTDLRLCGWTVLAYGPAETFTRPWTAPNEVRRALSRRAPHLLNASGRFSARVAANSRPLDANSATRRKGMGGTR